MLRDLAPADGNAPALEEIIGSRGWARCRGSEQPVHCRKDRKSPVVVQIVTRAANRPENRPIPVISKSGVATIRKIWQARPASSRAV